MGAEAPNFHNSCMKINDIAIKYGFTKQKNLSGSDSLWRKETEDEVLAILQYSSSYIYSIDEQRYKEGYRPKS